MKNLNINKNNTLTILDWDDTLFPSTWVSINEIDLRNDDSKNKYKNYLSDYDLLLHNFLKKLTDISKVIIITNALPIWIKISSGILPNTENILKQIKVISAKQDFKDMSNDMSEWKKYAFRRELKIHSEDANINNLISIGDAHYEYNALVEIIKEHGHDNNKVFKAVKLIRYPSLNILQEQIHLLNSNINDIILKKNHLDLCFQEIK